MATRSLIGSIQNNGTVKTIYCHWDGYPGHNGEMLLNHYNTPSKVEELIEQGDLSSLEYDIDHCRLANCSWELRAPREVELGHLADVAGNYDAEYVYVYNDEFEWQCYEYNYNSGKLHKIKILAAVA